VIHEAGKEQVFISGYSEQLKYNLVPNLKLSILYFINYI